MKYHIILRYFLNYDVNKKPFCFRINEFERNKRRKPDFK